MNAPDLPTDVSVLVSSWRAGLFEFSETGRRHEMKGRCVDCLASDGRSGVLAVVDGTSLLRRPREGAWAELAHSSTRVESCLAANGFTYAGTDGAHLLRVGDGGVIERVDAFDAVSGRDEWFAGSAVVDGEVVGPPLGVRSMAGSTDGDLVFAGVHVGGIVRSEDGGASWHPTIDINWDVHEVVVHPEDPSLVIAACAVGLAVSLDGGVTWELEMPTSDETYCSAAAFSGEDLLVSVSANHFAPHGSVFRRAIRSPEPLSPVGGGLPYRLNGIVDTRCIAAKDSHVIVVDGGGDLYSSDDSGRRWKRVARGIPSPSGALIV